MDREPVGAKGVETETVTEAQDVVLHEPEYRTKYVVVLVGVTVMVFPVPIKVLAQDPANHCAIAFVPATPPDTVKVVEPPAQIEVFPIMLLGVVEDVPQPPSGSLGSGSSTRK